MAQPPPAAACLPQDRGSHCSQPRGVFKGVEAGAELKRTMAQGGEASLVAWLPGHGLEVGPSVMDGDREKEMRKMVLGETESTGLHRGADTGPAARSSLGKRARPAQPRGDINMGGSDATASRKLPLLSSQEDPPRPDFTDTPCCAGTVLTTSSLPLAERHSAASVPYGWVPWLPNPAVRSRQC